MMHQKYVHVGVFLGLEEMKGKKITNIRTMDRLSLSTHIMSKRGGNEVELCFWIHYKFAYFAPLQLLPPNKTNPLSHSPYLEASNCSHSQEFCKIL
jgi:hypothetical protein